MPSPESARRAPVEPGSDVLRLLAEALVGRVEDLIRERADRLAASAAPEPAVDRRLKVSEVAERVGACERTVYRALRSGALAGERLGTHWRIHPAAIDAWLAASREASSARRPSAARAVSPSPVQPREKTFMARARALRSTPPAAAQPSNNGYPRAPHEEPS